MRHGLTRTTFYRRYRAIKNRCNDLKNNRFDIYGGRGIKCLWPDFQSFKYDMYNKYRAHISRHGEYNTQIDRIDVDGNYCKKNCRWVTRTVNANNKRNIKKFSFKGKTQTLTAWSKELGINFFCLYTRIYREKWTIERALNPQKRINQYV